jgi:Protein of unknown function (DUF2975)
MDTNASGRTTKGWRALIKRDCLAFDRSDYLGAKIVLGITVAGSVVFGLLGPILNAVNNAPLPVTYLSKVTGGIPLPRGATLEGPATVQVLLKDATLGERLTQAIPAFLVAGLTIAIVGLLVQLLRTTQAGEPFTKKNVLRINIIALIVGIGGMLVQLAGGVADNAIQTTRRMTESARPSFEMTFTLMPLAVMLVIALVGEAFRRGVVLREDVDGLV